MLHFRFDGAQDVLRRGRPDERLGLRIVIAAYIHQVRVRPSSEAATLLLRTTKNMRVNRRCGLHPWENNNERPNLLSVSVRMYGEYQSDGLAHLDYDPLRNLIRNEAKPGSPGELPDS